MKILLTMNLPWFPAVGGANKCNRALAVLGERLQAFAPDRVLVASEDPSQNLLAAALQTTRAPVIYLAHTPAFLPFGPQAFFPARLELMARDAGLGALPTVAGVAAAVAGLGEESDMDEVAAVVLELNELPEDDVQRRLAGREGTMEETAS